MDRLSFTTKVALTAALTFTIPVFGWPPDPDPEPEPQERARIIVTDKASGSYLGIGVVEVTAERAKVLNLNEERGVEITRVEENSAAEKGGLKTGDVVLEYNGERVEGVEQFMRMVRETPPGRDVKLSLSRSGSMQTATVKTSARKGWASAQGLDFPRTFTMPEIRMPDMPRANMTWRSGSLGIEAESLEPQLAAFFGVKEGVLVRSVAKGSAAEKAGLKAGDVIVKVDDKSVTSPREITVALRASAGKKTATITAFRDKRETALSVNLDDVALSPGRSISSAR